MPGWSQILIVVVLAFLLFGRGKISEVMGDFAKGIKSFKRGMAEDDTPKDAAGGEDAKVINHDADKEVVSEKVQSEAK